MAVERRSPLPPGRYSVFVLAGEGAMWSGWLARHRAAVTVLSQIDRFAVASSVPVFATRWDGTIIEDLVGTSILFDVRSPVPWDVPLGFPTIETTGAAPRPVEEWHGEVTDVSEAHQNPAPDLFARLQGLLLGAGAVALAVLWLSPRKGPRS